MKRKGYFLYIFSFFVFLSFSHLAECRVILSYNFENFSDIKKLQKVYKTGGIFSQTKKYVHSGKYGLEITPNLYHNSSVRFSLPSDISQGVLTFWIYDPIFKGPKIGENFRPGFQVGCIKRESPKKISSVFYLDTGRESPYWWFSTSGDTPREGICTGVLRHSGWTRIDFINPGGKEPRKFIICIDGRKVMQTPEKYLKFNYVIVRSFWGSGTIYLDDISYDDNPNNFRPNVLQKIVCGDEAHNVQIFPGQSIPVELYLSPQGAKSSTGILNVYLLDGRENIVYKKTFPINWNKPKNKIDLKIPAPLGSRLYRFKAIYTEKATGINDEISVLLNVQVVLPSVKKSKHARLVLKKSWEWLPGKPDDVTIPSDWSNAEKVNNAWVWRNGRRRKDIFAGWYRREISIPKGWENRRIFLVIDQPQTKAKVFVNRNFAGEIHWPGGKVDITKWIKPGNKIELILFVSALPDVSYLKVAKEILGEKVKLPSRFTDIINRGLLGEVALETEPFSSRVEGVFIQPSVMKKSLKLTFEFADLLPGNKYQVRGSITDAGKTVKTFNSSFKATFSCQNYTLEIPWENPVLWDIGKPYFYDLNTELLSSNKIVDIMLPIKFGFREVTFNGRLVLVNGRPVNLFLPPIIFTFANEGLVKWLERYHLNYITSNHHNYFYTPGRNTLIMDAHYNFCDEAGIGTDLSVSDIAMRKFILLNQIADDLDPKYWAEYKRVVTYAFKRYRNHPSIFFYNGGGGGGQLEMGGMYNPMLMDGIWIKDFSDQPIMKNLLKIETKALDFIHNLDPTRKVISQDSGNFGDSCHITHYAGWMPIQEMIEANEYWRENGVKPYMITEQSAPFYLNWTDAPVKWGYSTKDIIGYVAEWAAVTKGDRAFHRLPIDQKELSMFENLTQKNVHPHFRVLYAYRNKGEIPCVFNEVIEDRARELWLNWRTDGIGLLCPWEPGLGSYSIAMKKYLAPLTGFIAGTEKKRTAKDHIFFPGETFERQIIILNNRRNDAVVTCYWSLSINGKKIRKGKIKAIVPGGGKKFVPVKVKLPKWGDYSGSFNMILAENGKIITKDKITINILKPEKMSLKSKIALIDPEGDTAKLLKRLGIKFQRLNFGSNLSSYEIIIFGRRAFQYEDKSIRNGVNLENLTREGKKILIMEQSEETLRNRFHFRTEYISARNTFGRIKNHPVLKGLSDETLSYWRGSSTLTDGYAIARNQNLLKLEHNGGRWFYLWNDGKEHPRPIKWGNTHNVATIVIIKPETGNFRTLIDCGFNLNYASLFELDNSSGKIVFCQMDCSGRTEIDPAADRLIKNILKYLDKVKPIIWKKCVYLGEEKGENILKLLRVKYHKISSLKETKGNEVLILGHISPDTLKKWREDLANFVFKGGIIFSLAKNEKELTDWLPFKIKFERKKIDSTIIDKPEEPLLAGLSNAELYWKGKMNIVAITKVPKGSFKVNTGLIARIPYGKGQYIFCQIEPDMFNLKKRFYMKDSRNLTYRLIQNLINNLHIPMEPPAFMKNRRTVELKIPPMNLSGKWSGCAVKENIERCPEPSNPRWHSINVPGYWEEQGLEWATYDGYFWYRKGFIITDKIPEDASPTLILGAIDDEDDTFINGRKIGHTGRDTNPNDYWLTPRQYAIPKGVLRQGYNEITILVHDLRGSGGIIGNPKIVWESPQKIAEKKLKSQPYLFQVGKEEDPYWYRGW